MRSLQTVRIPGPRAKGAHIFEIVAEMELGTLARIIQVFSRRGIEVLELTYREKVRPCNCARINVRFVPSGDIANESLEKQLDKIIGVLKVRSR